MIRAHQALSGFRGNPAQVPAWLRRILANVLSNLLREFLADRRSIGREQSLEDQLAHSSIRLAQLLAAPDASPSEQMEKSDEVLKMCRLLEELPDDQREAVVLHHLQGRPVKEVGEIMGLSRVGVAGLIKRGLRQLRAKAAGNE
jgi:RNA polymerase sigma-70 factor (ECF subfamily)